MWPTSTTCAATCGSTRPSTAPGGDLWLDSSHEHVKEGCMTELSRRRFLGATDEAPPGPAGAGGIWLEPTLHRSAARRHYTAIVVGSGYGGAVSALRLRPVWGGHPLFCEGAGGGGPR